MVASQNCMLQVALGTNNRMRKRGEERAQAGSSELEESVRRDKSSSKDEKGER